MPGKFMSDVEKAQILTMMKENVPFVEIARRTQRGLATIRKLKSAALAQPGVTIPKNKPITRKTSKVTDSQMRGELLKNPQLSASELKKAHSSVLGEVSLRTIQDRLLKDLKMPCRLPAKKPLLAPSMEKAQMEFAQQYTEWTPEHWSKVMLSKESTFKCVTACQGRIRRPVRVDKYDPRFTAKMMQNIPKCSVVLHKLPDDVIAGGGKFTDLHELSLAPGRVKSEGSKISLKEGNFPASGNTADVTDPGLAAWSITTHWLSCDHHCLHRVQAHERKHKSSMPKVSSISATVIPPEPMKEEQNETVESITVKEEPIFHETDKTQAGDASKLSSLWASADVCSISPVKREADFDSPSCVIQQSCSMRRCHDKHMKVESGSAASSSGTVGGATSLLEEGTTEAACSSVSGVAQFAYGTENKNSSLRGESRVQHLSSSGPCRYIWNKFKRLNPIMEISSSSLKASPCPSGDKVLGDISSTQTICVSRKIVPAAKKISRSTSPITNSSEATCHDDAVGVELGLRHDSDRTLKMSCKIRCSKPQMFKCSECSFAYSKKSRLRTHIQRRHSGRKPSGPSCHFVKCAQCEHNGGTSHNVPNGKIFQGCLSKKPRLDHVSNSNDHFEAQRTAKQFYCPTCDFSSTYKGRLIRHILNSHPSDFYSPICSQCEFLCFLSKLFAQNL